MEESSGTSHCKTIEDCRTFCSVISSDADMHVLSAKISMNTDSFITVQINAKDKIRFGC